MNKLVIIVVVFSFLISCNSVRNETADDIEPNVLIEDDSSNLGLPDNIKDLPLKIVVFHEPDTIFAQVHEKGTGNFIWKHTTTIKSIESNIQIIEFGSYNLKNGEWVLGNFTNKPFTAKEFESWYFKKSKQDIISWENCTDAYMVEGQEYVDPSNWSITQDSLIERNGLWYYIGMNDSGEKVAGYARYYAAPEMRK